MKITNGEESFTILAQVNGKVIAQTIDLMVHAGQ